MLHALVPPKLQKKNRLIEFFETKEGYILARARVVVLQCDLATRTIMTEAEKSGSLPRKESRSEDRF